MQNTNKEKELQQKHADALKENRNKLRNRKARTRRLIVRGALAEKALQAEHMSDTEFEEALFRAVDVANYYTNTRSENMCKAKLSETPRSDSR